MTTYFVSALNNGNDIAAIPTADPDFSTRSCWTSGIHHRNLPNQKFSLWTQNSCTWIEHVNAMYPPPHTHTCITEHQNATLYGITRF